MNHNDTCFLPYTMKLADVLNYEGMLRYYRDVLGRITIPSFESMRSELIQAQVEIKWERVDQIISGKDRFNAWRIIGDEDGDVTFDIHDINYDFRAWLFTTIGSNNPRSNFTLWDYITAVQRVFDDNWRSVLEFKMKRQAPKSTLDAIRNVFSVVFDGKKDDNNEQELVVLDESDDEGDDTHSDRSVSHSPTSGTRSRLVGSQSPSPSRDGFEDPEGQENTNERGESGYVVAGSSSSGRIVFKARS